MTISPLSHDQFCNCIPDFLTDGGGFDYLFLMPSDIQLLGGKSINEKEKKMANPRPTNGPSITGNKSGSGRGNNPPKGK